MTKARGVTPDELSGVMQDAGKPCTAKTIRYHCRTPGGWLYGKARLIGRSWEIDADAADDFAARWKPYESLRK